MASFDFVVVGAGTYGLAAAQHLRYTHPDASLAIFEDQASLGGTWATERLYPGLKSNKLFGTYEFPGYPMKGDPFGVKVGQHIPGVVINAYLTAFAKDSGIADLIHFNTKVLSAEHQDHSEQGGRILALETLGQPEKKTVLAHRLGQEDFGGKLFHTRDFKQNSDTLKSAKAVTIFGAGKAGWNAVYEYATAGVKVNWIIRASGHGPCWMSPPYVTPLKKWIEKLATTRLLTWFSLCIWGEADVSTFWKILHNDVLNLNDYDSHPDTAKLKPWIEPMFTGGSVSIFDYEKDILELIKTDIIDMHVADIDHLSAGKVNLTDGTVFETDVLVASTGWKPMSTIKFLPEGIEKELGIPHPNVTHRGSNYKPASDGEDLTPYMLHRYIVPPAPHFLRNRDVAFTGMISNTNNPPTAHLSGLWISAYFAGKLMNDPSAALLYETVLYNRFGKWRYPIDWGNKCPNFIFDAVPLFDMLQRDLGLNPHRKKGWLAEFTKPYGADDYQDVTDEWLRLNRGWKYNYLRGRTIDFRVPIAECSS
ncbi:FAD/NAD(P)-binding domain-containing protein [Xylariaceae sp. FL0255]|nr:FAD/NAD(P)-binding domain-containing protein [Xylariaceae sp. FL0255]